MNSRKTFFIMIAIFVLLIGLLGTTVVLGNGYLKQQADKLLAAKLDQRSLNEQQTALIKAKKDLEKYSELREIAKSIVPQDKDQARAVREIVQLANESGVTLESVTFDDSSLGQPQASSPSSGGDKESDNSTPKAPPITQAQPVEGISGLYAIPITIVSTKEDNQFANFLSFLGKLENNRRTAQVERVSITPGVTRTGQEYINFSLTVNVFVKP